MKIVKFIKVNTVIINIVLAIYEIITAFLAITWSYSSDREIALFAFAISTVALLITNISSRKLIDIFEKTGKKK